jgi:hypothetical protein
MPVIFYLIYAGSSPQQPLTCQAIIGLSGVLLGFILGKRVNGKSIFKTKNAINFSKSNDSNIGVLESIGNNLP